MRKKIIGLLMIFTFLLTSGFGCKSSNQQVQQSMTPMTLNVWGVYDDSDSFTDIINNYKALHPYITINYRKFRYDEYEDQLLNAFAEDRGPDIFAVNNTWMKKYEAKLAPLPAQTQMVVPVVEGSIQKQTVQTLVTNKSLSLTDLKNNFVDVVYHDVVDNNQIYGLPLALDTLALYYNRDLLNNAGITTIPQYWNREFQQDVQKLTKQDLKGNIIQSGVALGGSRNINRYSDILSTLIMQNGGAMMDDSGSVLFHTAPPGGNYNPGAAALSFYTDFSNPIKEVYSWNNDLPNSLTSFIGGSLAFMFSYAYDLPTIKAQAPKMNFGVAPLPQIEGASNNTNFANYWIETVSKKSAHVNESWDFVQFMTSANQVKSYLDKSKKPAALRALIDAQRSDPDVGVFAGQVLTAKSWYRGYDAQAAEEAIAEMIDSTIKDGTKIQDYMNLAASRVQQTVNQQP